MQCISSARFRVWPCLSFLRRLFLLILTFLVVTRIWNRARRIDSWMDHLSDLGVLFALGKEFLPMTDALRACTFVKKTNTWV
jgi:hypothetical protein